MSGLSALGSPWSEVFGLPNDVGRKWIWALKHEHQRSFPDDKKLIYQHLLDDMTNSLGLRPFPVDKSGRSTLGTNIKNGSCISLIVSSQVLILIHSFNRIRLHLEHAFAHSLSFSFPTVTLPFLDRLLMLYNFTLISSWQIRLG